MKSVRLVLYLNQVFDLYEVMIVKYSEFHVELPKREMSKIRSRQTQIVCMHEDIQRSRSF